jgi:hypothetical protein
VPNSALANGEVDVGFPQGLPLGAGETAPPKRSFSDLLDKAKNALPSKEQAAVGAAVAGTALLGYRIAKSDTTNPVIPDKSLVLGPSTTIAIEKLVYWGAFIGAAYLVLDPLAPNWEIEEAQFPEQHYHMALKMKRLYTGGAGEAQQVFRQRAQELMRRNGYRDYAVMDYSEGLESSLLGSQRVARGVIQLRNPG